MQVARDAEFGGEVVRADQQNVDAGHRGDCLGVGDAFRRFQHGYDERQRVRLRVNFAERRRPVILQRPGAGHRAAAGRRELAGIDQGFGLLRRFDLRTDDAERAGVKQLCRHVEIVAGNAR